ncbi:MAG: MlaA family lipoprotein [Planctomycetota bacterium]|jgi:phospholipid-binding lipoprotein MlaA
MTARPRPALGLALALCLAFPACTAASRAPDYDPLETMNRGLFAFNDAFDKYVLTPTGKGWDKIAAEGVKDAFSNFFDNLLFANDFLNNALQGKPRETAEVTGRFVVNTTVGLLGFFDPATDWGMPAHHEDFGQTLGYWGIAPGAYITLPFWGPSNGRDTIGFVVDWFTPYSVSHILVFSADAVNDRSQNIQRLVDLRAAALDWYVFVRNAYSQSRAALIADTTEMEPEVEEDLYDIIDDE